jgi:hypothetical protein
VRRSGEDPSEKPSVWAVLSGQEDEDGEVANANVHAVYATRQAAKEHFEYVSTEPTDRLMYWVEEWDVRDAFDPDDERAL